MRPHDMAALAASERADRKLQEDVCMLVEACGVDRDAARQALRRCDGGVNMYSVYICVFYRAIFSALQYYIHVYYSPSRCL